MGLSGHFFHNQNSKIEYLYSIKIQFIMNIICTYKTHLQSVGLKIYVTIGRVLFSDSIAFVDVIFRRTYSSLMLFYFTWLLAVSIKRLKENNGGPDESYILYDLAQINKMEWHNSKWDHK